MPARSLNRLAKLTVGKTAFWYGDAVTVRELRGDLTLIQRHRFLNWVYTSQLIPAHDTPES